jgi:hypothetical protein
MSSVCISLLDRLKRSIVDENILDIEQVLTELFERIEESEYVPKLLGDNGIYYLLKELLDNDLIISDELCVAFLSFLSRICRRTMEKSSSCLTNIAAISNSSFLTKLVEVIAKNLHDDSVLRWGNWLIAIIASDSSERQCLLDECGATIGNITRIILSTFIILV